MVKLYCEWKMWGVNGQTCSSLAFLSVSVLSPVTDECIV